MNWLSITLSLASLACFSFQGAVVSHAITSPLDTPYMQTEHRITVDGRERTFIVQEPKVKRVNCP